MGQRDELILVGHNHTQLVYVELWKKRTNVGIFLLSLCDDIGTHRSIFFITYGEQQFYIEILRNKALCNKIKWNNQSGSESEVLSTEFVDDVVTN